MNGHRYIYSSEHTPHAQRPRDLCGGHDDRGEHGTEWLRTKNNISLRPSSADVVAAALLPRKQMTNAYRYAKFVCFT